MEPTKSSILIPPEVLEAQRKWEEDARLEAIRQEESSHRKRMVEIFCKHLAALEDDLGEFPMTCHASILFYPTLERVMGTICDMVKSPTAYMISEASQRIRQFIRVNGGK